MGAGPACGGSGCALQVLVAVCGHRVGARAAQPPWGRPWPGKACARACHTPPPARQPCSPGGGWIEKAGGRASSTTAPALPPPPPPPPPPARPPARLPAHLVGVLAVDAVEDVQQPLAYVLQQGSGAAAWARRVQQRRRCGAPPEHTARPSSCRCNGRARLAGSAAAQQPRRRHFHSATHRHDLAHHAKVVEDELAGWPDLRERGPVRWPAGCVLRGAGGRGRAMARPGRHTHTHTLAQPPSQLGFGSPTARWGLGLGFWGFRVTG
jgi:hypothetical protein